MLEDLIRERERKLKLLADARVPAYPARVARTHTTAEAREKFAALSRGKKAVSLAGRVMSRRDQGNIIFLDLADSAGNFQIVLKKDSLRDFPLWKKALDLGDFISATGTLFTTKSGMQSLEAKKMQMAAKALRPLPSEWHGLEDAETRLRDRYLDMLSNPEVRELFVKKGEFWSAFREALRQEGFLEMETPVFEQVPGGADAEPFKTHHNALDADFYLRISLELPLKKIIVGGFEKVFEIGRVFRNEGIDREHLQDYTQLEFYWAYRDYEDLMKFVEPLYKQVVKAATGGLTTEWDGKKIQWGKKWLRVDYVEAFKKENKLDPRSASLKELRVRAKELGLEAGPELGKGRLIDSIYKKTVRPKLVQPCFLVNPPVEIEPLAKRLAKDPRVVERVQVVACGTELGKGFSELNDPADQRARFEEQMKMRAAGDKEAQRLDEEFLRALEHGLPPTAGFGLSERLFAVLMNKPVRETVIFPLMKPRKHNDK